MVGRNNISKDKNLKEDTIKTKMNTWNSKMYAYS